jgi:pimeloyl-ACP methyl ester carboxylesterase
MVFKRITTSWFLFQTILATPVQFLQQADGYCTQLNIPVPATAPSAVYDIQRVDNDIEATAWAIHYSTWSTPRGVQTIVRNTTTSGIFNIHAKLCVPKASRENDILQIASHGIGYDSRYWDSEYQPEKHSYVAASLKAGYSILAYDRLGVGQSDHPNAYDVVQSPLELEILRQLTLMARNGTLYSLAAQVKPANAAFDKLIKPSKVVHVGHSYGSILSTALIARYGNLSDGAIITGYIPNQYFGSSGLTAFSFEYAATSSSSYDRPSGYVVSKKNGVQNVFFGGNPKTAFTPELLDYGNDIKQPAPVGEFQSDFQVHGNIAHSFKAPVQYLLPENDYVGCAGDCKGVANLTALMETYPVATAIEVVVQPNTGHALPFHNNATAGFQLSFDFLAKNGL